jgi:SNW domain-containing protein 1
MSLLAALPAPRQEFGELAVSAPPTTTTVTLAARREPPPYLRRQGFIPRRPDDFCDGGAFPEVHVAQYPLEMGRPDQAHGSGKTLAVTTNADGELNFDAIVNQGRNREKFVHSSHKALVPKIDELKEAVSAQLARSSGNTRRLDSLHHMACRTWNALPRRRWRPPRLQRSRR